MEADVAAGSVDDRVKSGRDEVSEKVDVVKADVPEDVEDVEGVGVELSEREEEEAGVAKLKETGAESSLPNNDLATGDLPPTAD